MPICPWRVSEDLGCRRGWTDCLFNFSAGGVCDGCTRSRFQFAAVSMKDVVLGMHTGPISAKDFSGLKPTPVSFQWFWLVRLLPSLRPILDAQSAMLWVGVGTAAALSFGLTGIAVGMGAIYPDFKTSNASKLAAGPAGLLYMLTALGLVFVYSHWSFSGLLAHFSNNRKTNHRYTVDYWECLPISSSGALYVCNLCPINYGARKLWERGYPMVRRASDFFWMSLVLNFTYGCRTKLPSDSSLLNPPSRQSIGTIKAEKFIENQMQTSTDWSGSELHFIDAHKSDPHPTIVNASSGRLTSLWRDDRIIIWCGCG